MSELDAVHPIITALGWTLIHFLWQGLVLGALYALVIALLRDASASTRYWVGMGALAAMLLGAIVTFTLVYQAPVVSLSGPALVVGTVSVQAVSPDVSSWDAFILHLETMLPWAVLAWLSGVFLLSGRIALDFWRIRKLAIEGVRPLPDPWPALVERMCRSLGLRRLVSVVESARVSVPMVVGWLKPVILIPPSSLMGLTHKQLELIISHELAHVKRLDYLFNVLQLVVETLLFYHPVVRYVATQVRVERENCCDDIVVARSGDTLAYARALTEVEGLRCSSGMQVVLAATGGHLASRVRRLAGMPAPQRGVIQWFAVLMLVGASATALTGAQYVVDHHNLEESAAAPETVAEPDSVPVATDTPEPAIAPALAARTETAPAISRLDRAVTRSDKASIAAVPPSPQEAPSASSEVVATVAAPPVRHIAVADVAPKPEPTVAPVTENVAVPETVAVSIEPVIDSVPKEPASTEAPKTPAPVVGGGAVKTPVGPKYPRQAKLRGIEGFVKVGYVVNREGRVENVEILDAVPAQIFDNTVAKALKKWRYEPFTVDGVPSDQMVTQVFEFNVERGELDETEKPARCRRSTGTRLCRDSMDPGIVGVSVVYNTL